MYADQLYRSDVVCHVVERDSIHSTYCGETVWMKKLQLWGDIHVPGSSEELDGHNNKNSTNTIISEGIISQDEV